jgi:ribose/xylose/arabinose/galactoside ABC-type transport system permease subunit
MKLWHHLNGPHARPFAVLAACIVLLTAVDGGHGQFLSAATAYSTLQTFATISLVTLGLGLTMMIREFDLSVVGMYGMAGCIAVLTGTHYPWIPTRWSRSAPPSRPAYCKAT